MSSSAAAATDGGKVSSHAVVRSTSSSLSFADVTEVYGKDFGVKPHRGPRRSRKAASATVQFADDACVAAEEREGILGPVMEEYIRAGTQVPEQMEPLDAHEAQPRHTLLTMNDPVARPFAAAAPISASASSHMLDVAIFIFCGVLIIFMMEQLVQIGIQIGLQRQQHMASLSEFSSW
jgi:hypothetical protein